jgi:hypothetical protein
MIFSLFSRPGDFDGHCLSHVEVGVGDGLDMQSIACSRAIAINGGNLRYRVSFTAQDLQASAACDLLTLNRQLSPVPQRS